MGLAVDAANDAAEAAWLLVDEARLHTGAPGAAGTSNVLGTGDDAVLTFGAAADGEMVSGSLSYGAVSASGTVTHLSLWDGATYRGDAELSAPTVVTIGQPLVISRVRVRILV